jgi:hypothetical protein
MILFTAQLGLPQSQLSLVELAAAPGLLSSEGAKPIRRYYLLANSTMQFQRPASVQMSISSYLTFFRGEDVQLNFQLQPPQDITGWTLSMKLATQLGGTVQFTKSATIVDAGRGLFQFTIASADTSGLAVGRYVWDVRREDSGSKSTLADGYLDLRQEVTA